MNRRYFVFYSFFLSFSLVNAMDWRQPLFLTARGFVSGCMTGIIQNQYGLHGAIFATSMHDGCDQFCGLDPDGLQLFSHEIPAYMLGGMCGVRARRLVPLTWQLYVRSHLHPVVASFCGLSDHVHEF
jgi:hypothetical protein